MNAELADALVPLAAELVATVRDYGPDDVAAVLSRVPDGRHDALAVVLAAMVNPDARPSELLAWTNGGPVKSRDRTPAHLFVAAVSADALGRCPERREEIARLTRAGLPVKEIAARLNIVPRSVIRHRRALREAAELCTPAVESIVDDAESGAA